MKKENKNQWVEIQIGLEEGGRDENRQEGSNTEPLTFLIVLQQKVVVPQLTENIRVHLPLCFQDEGVIAANSLEEGTTTVQS